MKIPLAALPEMTFSGSLVRATDEIPAGIDDSQAVLVVADRRHTVCAEPNQVPLHDQVICGADSIDDAAVSVSADHVAGTRSGKWRQTADHDALPFDTDAAAAVAPVEQSSHVRPDLVPLDRRVSTGADAAPVVAGNDVSITRDGATNRRTACDDPITGIGDFRISHRV